MEVAGPKTNLAFLAAVMGHEAFMAGDIDTGFIDRHLDELVPAGGVERRVLALGVAAQMLMRRSQLGKSQGPGDELHSPWTASDGWILGGHRSETLKFVVAGEQVALAVTPEDSGWRIAGVDDNDILASATLDDDRVLTATVDGVRLVAACVPKGAGFVLVYEGSATEFEIVDPLDVDVVSDADTGALKAPMPGKIVQVLAEPGAKVRKGAALIVMEAMKMEQTLVAGTDAVIADVHVGVGDQVEAGAALVGFEEQVG